jgi:hypothetical protein
MPDIHVGTSALPQIVHYDEAQLVKVDRVDFSGRKIGKVQKTDEGYVSGDAAVARVGVMSYVLADGSTRRELVPHTTLFNTDSMASLKMKPITDSHPPERILDSKTVKRRKVGFTGETVKQDGDFLTSSITVTDDDAVSGINAGKQELSPGYTCELLMHQGTYNGDSYDAIQVRRKYNHLALCDKARGGSDLRLNFDSATRCDGFEVSEHTDSSDSSHPSTKGATMPMLKLDGIDYETPAQVVNHVTKQDSQITSLTKEIETVKADRDTNKEKLDVAEKRVANLDSEIKAAVKTRLDLERQALPILPKDTKLDTMSDAEIRKAVVLVKFPNAKLDDASADYLQARFDAALEVVTTNDDADAKNREKSAPRNDSEQHEDCDTEKARARMQNRMKNGYQMESKK